MSHRTAILEAKRTPIGKFLGAFRDYTAVQLGTDVCRQILDTSDVSPQEIDEVIFGNARQAGNGPNPARQVAFNAGVPQESVAYTVNAACGSGLKAIALADESIRRGNASCVLAGGTENMTRVPFILDGFRLGYRLGHARVVDGMYKDGFACPLSGMVMGETAEVLAGEYGVSRAEQDEYALMSQQRAEAAWDDGLFDDEVVAVTTKDKRGNDVVVGKDEHPRWGATIEGMGKLPPVFSKDGTVTAGNASGITDGAAAVIVASEEKAAALGKKPLAYVVDFVSVGVDPKRMGIGPVPATRRLLERNGLKLDDIPVVELNEAFAAQVIACERELEFDRGRVNRRGGGISLGHPIGCTGARIVVTLLHEMKRADAGLGIATLCVSGGLGMAMLLSRT